MGIDDGASTIRNILHDPCKLGYTLNLEFLIRDDREGGRPEFCSIYKWHYREIYQELAILMSEALK